MADKDDSFEHTETQFHMSLLLVEDITNQNYLMHSHVSHNYLQRIKSIKNGDMVISK